MGAIQVLQQDDQKKVCGMRHVAGGEWKVNGGVRKQA